MVVIGHFYFVDVTLARLMSLAIFSKPQAPKSESCFRDRREASLLVKEANGLSKSWVSGMGGTFVLPLG
jgi:hypothetical protein